MCIRDRPITSPYLVTTPDFVACHVPSYVDKYDVLKGLKAGGSFLLNSCLLYTSGQLLLLPLFPERTGRLRLGEDRRSRRRPHATTR